MQFNQLVKRSAFEWEIPPTGNMRVPAIIYASEELIKQMDDKVAEQAMNVASLPGIVGASYAMPDAHWGYGFPIGGVAAFDPDEDGVISVGGVGFDISCGVRTICTGLQRQHIDAVKRVLSENLCISIPAGVGSTGSLHLTKHDMDAMLLGGARWALERGYGRPEDLSRIEEHGCMQGAKPQAVSIRAKKRQLHEMGTLGSGNHYLEVQEIKKIFNKTIAAAFGLVEGDILVSIHCGSRGLGHQIGTDFLREMVVSAAQHNIRLPDRELACAPIKSRLGKDYLGAIRAGINCALANRQILTHLTRNVFKQLLPEASMDLLYDVSHNTCKLEQHFIDGRQREVYVHRKGATRAFGPGHADIPEALRSVGQPVLIGGSMGTASYILAGASDNEHRSFSSACHGAGRAMSRHAASKRWRGRDVVSELEERGIIIRSPTYRGVAEEAPGAYKDISIVVDVAEQVGLAKKVARLEPLICIKG